VRYWMNDHEQRLHGMSEEQIGSGPGRIAPILAWLSKETEAHGQEILQDKCDLLYEDMAEEDWIFVTLAQPVHALPGLKRTRRAVALGACVY